MKQNKSKKKNILFLTKFIIDFSLNDKFYDLVDIYNYFREHLKIIMGKQA
jgi:hypothetical protein